MKDIYASGSRTVKEYEIFVKEYGDLFLPKYEAECALQGAVGRACLPIWHKVAKTLWSNATEEQKEAVLARISSIKEASTVDEPSATSPAEYQK